PTGLGARRSRGVTCRQLIAHGLRRRGCRHELDALRFTRGLDEARWSHALSSSAYRTYSCGGPFSFMAGGRFQRQRGPLRAALRCLRSRPPSDLSTASPTAPDLSEGARSSGCWREEVDSVRSILPRYRERGSTSASRNPAGYRRRYSMAACFMPALSPDLWSATTRKYAASSDRGSRGCFPRKSAHAAAAWWLSPTSSAAIAARKSTDGSDAEEGANDADERGDGVLRSSGSIRVVGAGSAEEVDLARADAAGRGSGIHVSPGPRAIAAWPRSRSTTCPSWTATRVVWPSSALSVNVVPMSSSSPSGSTTRSLPSPDE